MTEEVLGKKERNVSMPQGFIGLNGLITPILGSLLIIAALYELIAVFSLPTGFALPMLCGTIGAAAAYAVNTVSITKERKRFVFVAFLFVYAVLIIVLNGLVADGIAAIINQIIDTWKQLRPYNYEIFRLESDEKICVGIVLSMAAFAGGVAASEYVHHPSSRAAVVQTVADAAILLLFAELIAESVMLVIVLKTGLVWILRMGADFGQLRIAVQKSGASVWLRASLVLCLAFFIGNTLLQAEEMKIAERISESCAQFITDIRYGNNSADGLTGGDLTKAGKLERRTDDVLKVTMSEPQSYYLRGFVGESYENNKWKTLDETDKQSLYENGDLFYWLHEDDFYAQTQIVNAAIAAGNIFFDSANSAKTKNETEISESSGRNKVTIENLKASSRYLYMPYETQSVELLDVGQIGDSNAIAKGVRGERKYEFAAAENIIVKYQKIGNALQKQKSENGTAAAESRYLTDEAAYNEFVYDNYLEMPMDIAQYLAEKFGDFVIENGQKHFDYQMAKQNILFYLGKSVKYSEETDEVSGDIDFVLKFLDGSKKGYDVHYATAAVMMFRYYGIPARYVEGYLITKDDVKAMKADEPFYIDGTHAHAWAEYYQDGVGWLPFEVTPSYLSIMSKMESYRDISGMLGQTVGSKKAENQQEEQLTEPNDTKFEMFWIKHKVEIIFAAVMLLLALLIALFVSWLMHERRKTAKRKESFMSEDTAEGIRIIHEYMMELLQAVGLKAENTNPLAYADFVAAVCESDSETEMKAESENTLEYAEEVENEAADMRKKYETVEKIWQEAMFSNHIMQETQRQAVLQLNEQIWENTWRKAGVLQKIKLKYVYFL